MKGLFVVALALAGFFFWRLLVLWNAPPIKEPEG